MLTSFFVMKEGPPAKENFQSVKIPLFDLDGTVFTSANQLHNECYKWVFLEVWDTEASADEIDNMGMTDLQVIYSLAALHGIERENLMAKLNLAQQRMAEYFENKIIVSSYSVLPGVEDLLKRLKRNGIPVGILTGNSEPIAWKKLEIAGLKDYFDFGAFGEVTDKRAELVKIAKERADEKFGLEFPIEKFVIIGDTPRDITCAKEAGIPVISVASGSYSSEELIQGKPDLLINSLSEGDKILSFLRS